MRVFVGAALQIQPAELGRTHTEEGEAALVIGIDQFLEAGGVSARMPSHPKG